MSSEFFLNLLLGVQRAAKEGINSAVGSGPLMSLHVEALNELFAQLTLLMLVVYGRDTASNPGSDSVALIHP